MDIKEIQKSYKDLIGKEITVSGWIKSNRDQKEFGFIDLNDGTTFKSLQVVYTSDMKDFDKISKLNIGSSIKVSGRRKKSRI